MRHVGLPAQTAITHILRMMDTIASYKGRFWLDGPRRREVAARTSLGWCTPGAAPQPYDAGWGQTSSGGSKPAVGPSVRPSFLTVAFLFIKGSCWTL